jgi:hypothetical protein
MKYVCAWGKGRGLKAHKHRGVGAPKQNPTKAPQTSIQINAKHHDFQTSDKSALLYTSPNKFDIKGDKRCHSVYGSVIAAVILVQIKQRWLSETPGRKLFTKISEFHTGSKCWKMATDISLIILRDGLKLLNDNMRWTGDFWQSFLSTSFLSFNCILLIYVSINCYPCNLHLVARSK